MDLNEIINISAAEEDVLGLIWLTKLEID